MIEVMPGALTLGLPMNEFQPEDKNISVMYLRSPTRNLICNLLNCTKVITTDAGLLRDWRGLADLCELPNQLINSYERDTERVNKILKQWYDTRKEQATIAKLIQYLEKLDRFDIIDDVSPLIEEDVKYYRERIHNASHQPIFNINIDDPNILTRQDVALRSGGLGNGMPQYQFFNAYLLYHDADSEFAEDMINRLENKYGFKLCVRGRDLLPGLDEIQATCQLIEERCHKLIVIISPEFLCSPESNAHLLFVSIAQKIAVDMRMKKIIPCIYKLGSVRLPKYLDIYSKLNFKLSSHQWERLEASLRGGEVAMFSAANSVSLTDVPNIQITECVEESNSHTQAIENTPSTNSMASVTETIQNSQNSNMSHHELGKLHSEGENSKQVYRQDSTLSAIDNSSLDSRAGTERKAPKKKSFLPRKFKFKIQKSASTRNADSAISMDSDRSNSAEIDKNHVEENCRKKDDVTTEKEKKEEKNKKIQNVAGKKLNMLTKFFPPKKRLNKVKCTAIPLI